MGSRSNSRGKPMKRYFDYTERERSDMTESQVESLMAAELMAAGVLKVDRPELLPEEAPAIPGETMYGIKAGYYECRRFGFRTADDAATAMALMIPLGSKYIGGRDFPTEKGADALTIEPFLVYSLADITNSKSVTEKFAANKKQNEAALAEYAKACDAITKVTDNVWENWHSCRSMAARLLKVCATFAEYQRLCDENDETSLKFLLKAFTVDEVTAAIAWYPDRFPDSWTAETISSARTVMNHQEGVRQTPPPVAIHVPSEDENF